MKWTNFPVLVKDSSSCILWRQMMHWHTGTFLNKQKAIFSSAKGYSSMVDPDPVKPRTFLVGSGSDHVSVPYYVKVPESKETNNIIFLAIKNTYCSDKKSSFLCSCHNLTDCFNKIEKKITIVFWRFENSYPEPAKRGPDPQHLVKNAW